MVELERAIHLIVKIFGGRNLTPGEAKICLKAALLLLPYPLLKQVLSLPALVRFYGGRLGAVDPTIDVARLTELIRRLLQLHRAMFRPNCVKQSLLLFHFLRGAGRDTQIHFGVAKTGEKGLHGHAWVSVDDRPIAETADPLERFKVICSFPEKPGGTHKETTNFIKTNILT